MHGAGAYVEDRPLAEGLAAELGATLELPRLPEDDMSVAAWAAPVEQALAGLTAEDFVVAHSFGATILLHALAASPAPPSGATLLAMPDWGPQGWDVADYVPPTPAPEVPLTLHHCRDDEIVPVAHLALAAAQLPGAQVFTHETGGHQLDGLARVVAAAARP